jgi:hypothetical protein
MWRKVVRNEIKRFKAKFYFKNNFVSTFMKKNSFFVIYAENKPSADCVQRCGGK